MKKQNAVCKITRPWTQERKMVCACARVDDVKKIEHLSEELKLSKSEILVRAVRAYYETVFGTAK